MTHPVPIHFRPVEIDSLPRLTGRIVAFADGTTGLSPGLRRLDRLTRGAILRFLESEAFGRLKPGEAVDLAWPAGLLAEAVQIVRLPKRADVAQARKAGGAIGRALTPAGATVLAESHPLAAEIAFGVAMRAYEFSAHKTGERKVPGHVAFLVTNPEAVAAAAAPGAAVAEGVFFTRDLVNEPANVLTTYDFAARLAAMQELGLDVEILEEEQLERLGMGALLGVGQGSESPSKVVVMQWNGGAKGAAPFALVGKGVVFDTGGISIKPAAGMEEMTMDMGGAAVVAGVMRTLALRKARANVVGLVGLVENMPDGRAQRPGDVVRTMKGDTVEVINTDAEGRLVLADVLWYAQERFKPVGMIDLATLTGAIIIALGHENTGVFSNSDDLCNAVLKAAKAEGEGAWRMPMGDAYDAKLKSRIADMMNVGGRDGGAITAAQFLQRFVKPEVPWCHLDIAGTALLKSESTLAPKGATGWGVMALNRLIREKFEAK
jgi:leucyl aminopeptidase